MRYELLYAAKALRQMLSLPAEFTEHVLEQLGELAVSPTGVSVPIASPPFAPRGQLFHFEFVDPAPDLWFFTVIFKYSQDELSLLILSITWREIIEQ